MCAQNTIAEGTVVSDISTPVKNLFTSCRDRSTPKANFAASWTI